MMLTRCPHCRTGFRIRPEQLRMRQGRVRCGHCGKPFNALEALLEEDGRTPVRLEDLEQREERPAPEMPPPEPLAPDFHLDVDFPAPAPDEGNAPEPEAAGEQDKDSAPLFVLEETVPDAQQALPIGASDDEVTELYIDGFAWQRREPRADTPAAEDGSAAREADEGGAFDLDFQLPAAADAPDQAPAADDSGLHFTIDEIEPPRDEPAAPSADGGVAGGDTPARDDEFSIDFIFPTPAEDESESPPAADEQAPAPVPASTWDEAEPDAAPFEEPTELGDTAAAAQPATANLPAADDDTARTPARPEPIEATPLPLRAAETEDDDAAGSGTPASAATLPPPPGADASLAGQPDDFALDEPESRRPALWGLGIGMLATILVAQSVILFRNSIVQIVPESQPLYRSLCASLGCDMPLPRESGYIAIGASDLQPDERRPGLYVLRTTIENRAPFQQALPHLELTLTDARDRAIARRVIAPRDWKPGSGDEAFEAGARLEADIPFAATELKPVGYRVYAFYP